MRWACWDFIHIRRFCHENSLHHTWSQIESSPPLPNMCHAGRLYQGASWPRRHKRKRAHAILTGHQVFFVGNWKFGKLLGFFGFLFYFFTFWDTLYWSALIWYLTIRYSSWLRPPPCKVDMEISINYFTRRGGPLRQSPQSPRPRKVEQACEPTSTWVCEQTDRHTCTNTGLFL